MTQFAVQRPEPAPTVDCLRIANEVAALAANDTETFAVLHQTSVVRGVIHRAAQVIVVAEVQVLEQPEHAPVWKRVCVLIVAAAKAFGSRSRAKAWRSEFGVELRCGQARTPVASRVRCGRANWYDCDRCRDGCGDKEDEFF